MPYRTFHALSVCEIKGHGTLFAVENPVRCHDFTHLLQENVLIHGRLYHVRAVEFSAHAPPWRHGELIGLLVEIGASDHA